MNTDGDTTPTLPTTLEERVALLEQRVRANRQALQILLDGSKDMLQLIQLLKAAVMDLMQTHFLEEHSEQEEKP